MRQVFHSARFEVSTARNIEDYCLLAYAPCRLVNFYQKSEWISFLHYSIPWWEWQNIPRNISTQLPDYTTSDPPQNNIQSPSSITVYPDERGRTFLETSVQNCQTTRRQIPPKNNIQTPSSITVYLDERGRTFLETSVHNCQTARRQIPPPKITFKDFPLFLCHEIIPFPSFPFRAFVA